MHTVHRTFRTPEPPCCVSLFIIGGIFRAPYTVHFVHRNPDFCHFYPSFCKNPFLLSYISYISYIDIFLSNSSVCTVEFRVSPFQHVHIAIPIFTFSVVELAIFASDYLNITMPSHCVFAPITQMVLCRFDRLAANLAKVSVNHSASSLPYQNGNPSESSTTLYPSGTSASSGLSSARTRRSKSLGSDSFCSDASASS